LSPGRGVSDGSEDSPLSSAQLDSVLSLPGELSSRMQILLPHVEMNGVLLPNSVLSYFERIVVHPVAIRLDLSYLLLTQGVEPNPGWIVISLHINTGQVLSIDVDENDDNSRDFFQEHSREIIAWRDVVNNPPYEAFNNPAVFYIELTQLFMSFYEPNIVRLLLMHDVELNPGPIVIAMHVNTGQVLSIDVDENDDNARDFFQEHSREIIAWRDAMNNPPYEAYNDPAVFVAELLQLFMSFYEPNIVHMLLMHDVELNPGPVDAHYCGQLNEDYESGYDSDYSELSNDTVVIHEVLGTLSNDSSPHSYPCDDQFNCFQCRNVNRCFNARLHALGVCETHQCYLCYVEFGACQEYYDYVMREGELNAMEWHLAGRPIGPPSLSELYSEYSDHEYDIGSPLDTRTQDSDVTYSSMPELVLAPQSDDVSNFHGLTSAEFLQRRLATPAGAFQDWDDTFRHDVRHVSLNPRVGRAEREAARMQRFQNLHRDRLFIVNNSIRELATFSHMPVEHRRDAYLHYSYWRRIMTDVSFENRFMSLYDDPESDRCENDDPHLYWSSAEVSDLPPYDYDGVWFQLMHDIETHPGEYCSCGVCTSEGVKRYDEGLFFKVVDLILSDTPDVKVREWLYTRIHNEMKTCHGHRIQLYVMLADLLEPYQYQGPKDESTYSWARSLLPELQHRHEHIHGFTSEARQTANEFIEILRSAGRDVRTTTSKVSGFFNSFAEVFEAINEPKNVMGISAIMFVILLFLRREYPSSACIALMSILFAGWALVKGVMPLIHKSIMPWFADVFESNKAQTECDDIVNLCVEAISLGLFTQNLSFKNLKEFGFTMCDVDRHSKSLTSFLTRVKDWLVTVVCKIATCCGYELNKEYTRFDSELQSIGFLLKEIMSTYLKEDGTLNLSINPLVDRIDLLILDMNIKLHATKEDAPIRQVILNFARTLDPVRKLLRESGYTERSEPFLYYVVSHPGAGKTFVADYVAKAAMTSCMTRMELLDFKSNPGRMNYSYPVGAKHHDAYHGQWGLSMNDAFTATDAEGVESEATFVVNAIGCNEFKLPQAVAEKKALVKMLSKFVAINGNMTWFPTDCMKSMRTQKALTRRLNRNCWYLTVKRQYWQDGAEKLRRYQPLGPGIDASDPRFFAEIDPVKAARNADPETGINYDCYEYVEWDCERNTTKVGGRVLDMEHWLQLQRELFKASCDSGVLKARSAKIDTDRLVNRRLAELDREERIQSDDVSYMSAHMDSVLSGDCDSDLSALDFDDCWDQDTHCDEFGRRGVLSHAQLHARISAKCKMYRETKVSLVPLLEAIDESDEFRSFVKQYILDCSKANERISFSVYDNHYKGDISHPVHTLLENILLSDLKEFVNWGLSNEFSTAMCLAMQVVKDKLFAAISVVTESFEYLRDSFCSFRENPMLWFVKHPIVGAIVCATSGFVVGYCVTSLIFLSFNLVSKFFSTSVPTEPVVEQVRTSNEVESNDRTDKDTTFINARLENCYKIVIRRHCRDGRNNVVYDINATHMWFLGGLVGFTNWHTFNQMEFYSKLPNVSKLEIGIYCILNSSDEPTHWFDFKELVFDHTDADQDRVYITFTPRIHHQANILRWFPSKNDVDFIKFFQDTNNRLPVCFARRRDGHCHTTDSYVTFGNHFVDYTVRRSYTCELTGETYTSADVGVPIKRIIHPNVFELNVRTQNGECGAACFWTGSERYRFTKYSESYQQPIFIYFHHSAAQGSGIGNGSMVFREDFSCVEKLIKTSISSKAERLRAGLSTAVKEFVLATNTDQACDLSFIPTSHTVRSFAPHHTVVALIDQIPYNPKSNITRTPLYNVFPRTRAPARLYDFDGKDILASSRASYGSNVENVIPFHQLQCVIEYTTDGIMSVSDEPRSRSTLSVEQAILGDVACHLPAIDRSTSPGPTLRYVKRMLNLKGDGKTWIFGNGELIDLSLPTAQAFIRLMDEGFAACDRGDRPHSLNADSLKDELREFEKQSNPRLFCSGDSVEQANMRRLFGNFAGWVYENRIKNGIAIGINPYSHEWDGLYNYLRIMSDDAVFGDFGKYDKRLISLLIYATKNLADKFYGDDDPINNQRRALYFENLVNSFHCVPDGSYTAIYEWLHGNTSGNFLTAIINSVANLCLCNFVFCAIFLRNIGKDIAETKLSELPLDYVTRNSRVATYGDDNAMSFRNMEYINFYSIQEAVEKYFGMEYTDELKGKSGVIVPPYRSISDGNFIARGFVLDFPLGEKKVLAPLKIRSILEAPQWYKNKPDPADLKRVVENSFLELSLHGKGVFDTYAPVLKKAYYKAFKRYPHFSEWMIAYLTILERDSPLYCPMTNLSLLEEDDIKFWLQPPSVPGSGGVDLLLGIDA